MVELIKNQCIGSQEESRWHSRRTWIQCDTSHPVARPQDVAAPPRCPQTEAPICTCCPTATPLKDKLLSERTDSPEGQLFEWIPLLTFSGNLAVIKTRNGYAAGIAYDIDMSRCPEILGTIPGSDGASPCCVKTSPMKRRARCFRISSPSTTMATDTITK